ncbi:MAG: hypothetical protein R3C41_06745 [Calditrichia bacterium]
MGKLSNEILTHFQCGECRKWWSIGDAPSDRRCWFCPWCGASQSFDDISDVTQSPDLPENPTTEPE